MNDYTRITIATGHAASTGAACPELSTTDFIDLLSQNLADIGYESFQTEGSTLTAFIPARLFDIERTEGAVNLAAAFGLTAVITEVEHIEGEDWNSEWEKNFFQPYVFGNNKCVVHSSFHTGYPACEHDIVIDPKMAFGTGHHSTTRLMAEALLTMDLKGLDVADIGTGSAILAILASKLGAREITAVEIDEFAYTNAVENVELNRCDNINLVLGEVGLVPARKQFDVLVANINRNIILASLKDYAARVANTGCILLSGFYEHDVEMVLDEAKRHGLTLLFTTTDNNWSIVGLTFEK